MVNYICSAKIFVFFEKTTWYNTTFTIEKITSNVIIKIQSEYPYIQKNS